MSQFVAHEKKSCSRNSSDIHLTKHEALIRAFLEPV
jgi:hypothetical protein